MLAVATACIKEPADNGTGLLTPADGEVVLRSAVRVPDAVAASTRSFGELVSSDDYKKLELWCVVFQDDGNPAANFLLQVVKAQHDPDNAEIDGEGNLLIPFTVALESTTENAVIHFIAINTEGWEDEETAKKYNPLRNIEYGPENVIIPRLKTEQGRDAYWQRIALGCPIMAENQEKIDELVSLWSPVPLIRNFAKISMEVTEHAREVFTMSGFCVVNTLDSGTIAPYNELHGFPSFVEALPLQTDSEGKSVRKYKPYNYYEITTGNKIISTDDTGEVVETEPIREPGYPYIGVRPNGWRVTPSSKTPTDKDLESTEAKYIYERPFTETEHTYIIIKGTYSGDNTDSYKGETYYKIDIGQSDEEGIFRFHNILRNFNYKIVITEVHGSGYESIEEAIVGNIYNNNISAAVETQHLLNISDGDDLMFVNFTSYVMVTSDMVKLKYRYYDLLGDNGREQEDQQFNVVKYKIENVSGEVFNSGSIVKGQNETDYNGPTERIWEVLELTPNTPTAEQQVSQILLYKPKGLSRRITFYLRQPWEFDGQILTYPGQHDHREADKATGQLTPGVVSDQGNKPLTIFFKLPIGLPKAMFPLQFVIESNRQNIENDKNGTIVVQSSTSLFKDEPEGITDIRIQYVKTVTWEEYDPDNKGDADSTTDNYDSKGNYIGNIVRCRFLTITDLSDTGDDQNPVTTVLIDNPYFVRGRTTFTRSSEVGDVDDDSTDNN